MAVWRFTVDAVTNDPNMTQQKAEAMVPAIADFVKSVMMPDAEVVIEKDPDVQFASVHQHISTRRSACEHDIILAEDERS